MRKSYMIKVLALVIMAFMGWNVFALGDGEVGSPSGCGNHDAGISEPHAGCTQNHAGCPHAKLAQADSEVGSPSGCGNHDAGISEPHAGCTQNHAGCQHAKLAQADSEVGTPSGCGNHDASISEPHAGCTQNHAGCQHAKLAQADTKGSTIETEGEITKNEGSTEPAAEKVTRKVAELDKKSCIKCGLCASVCPEKAISMVHHVPVIDPEKCTGCGTCVGKCPTKALALEDYNEESKEAEETSETPKHNCGNPGVIHHNCPHSQQNNAADKE